MSPRRFRPPLLLGLAAFAIGCPRGGDTGPSASTSALPPVAPARSIASLPPGRSPVPTPAEYAAAREVMVKGSSALKCETKMIREWLRVTCRGASDTGGTPSGVNVVRGGRGESITFASGGVTSLIAPVLEASDLEAVFSWTDKTYALVVKWPQGSPKPTQLGEFLRLAAPVDGAARASPVSH